MESTIRKKGLGGEFRPCGENTSFQSVTVRFGKGRFGGWKRSGGVWLFHGRSPRSQVSGPGRRFASVARGLPRLFIPKRVQVPHQAFQPLLDDMGVDLRGRNIGMAEQGLHHPQIRAVVQEVTCEGMT